LDRAGQTVAVVMPRKIGSVLTHGFNLLILSAKPVNPLLAAGLPDGFV
jgi:hypothetical protein